MTVYFLVEELGKFRFQMADVSFGRQEGCPGETYPESDSPSLFSKSPMDIGDL
jgi:hypothetical protein